MSSESVITVAQPRRSSLKPWQRLALWSASSVLGLGVAAAQIRFLPPLKDLLVAGFLFPEIEIMLLALWVGSAWCLDKPRYLGFTYPAFVAWAWLWHAVVCDGAGC